MAQPGQPGLTFNVIGRIGPAVRRRLARIVAQTALAVEGDARGAMAEAKHGRSYRRRGGRLHVASAPGEAPAIDTGALAGSVQAGEAGPLAWEVAVGAEYGAILEFGSEHIEPRPFLGPAVEAQREAFEAACEAAVGAGARDAGARP